ncbi:MAG: tRNA pseudouridine(38-40) synthase TruA [Castellaniella sp.]|uniref:tRNA pseudouridine(38-40) synthase TruA n=1 Tax=Castellaniella sp. TaxID=1955812 RepID=UPI003C762E5D
MSRIVLGLSYDGSGWHGWQTQPGGRTLQDTLEAALASFLATPSVATICAGRTDTGVHALQQIVHLDTDAVRRDESWVRGLNAHLPPSISVQWARCAAMDFHARFDARARTYFYVLRSAPVRSPMLHGRIGWVHDPLDDQAMRAAAECLLGEHDFSAFRSSECQAASPVRTMQALNIVRQGDFLIFEFRANAFLHHMVRNLMGTLVMIGRGRRPSDWAGDLLAGRDRSQAAPTFMPDGLYLAHVDYPQAPDLPILPPAAALHRHLGAWWRIAQE